MADYTLQYTASEIDNRLGRPLPVTQGGTGQTASNTNVSVTYNTTVASSHSMTVRRFPYFGMCFLRGSFVVTGQAVEANTWIEVASVPNAPNYTTALSISAINGGAAVIDNNGKIKVLFDTAQTSGQTRNVYVSGWWFA